MSHTLTTVAGVPCYCVPCDEYSKSMDRIAQLEAELWQREWQPIETAPKDGSGFIATDGKWCGQGYFCSESGVFVLANCHVTDPFSVELHGLTHWMPLPAAPAGGENVK
jgi:hypothetical protein